MVAEVSEPTFFFCELVITEGNTHLFILKFESSGRPQENICLSSCTNPARAAGKAKASKGEIAFFEAESNR